MDTRIKQASPSAQTSAKKARLLPDASRARIIVAAQQVIAEQGYPAASARAIAAQCGISPGTLTYHFPTMDGLLVAALRDASAQFTESIVASAQQETSVSKRLMYLVEAALPTSTLAIRNWKLWLEYWARAAHNLDLAALHGERYALWQSAVSEVIEAGVESGEFAATDARRSALHIVALLDGLGLQAVISGNPEHVDIARDILQTKIKDLLAAPVSKPGEHKL